MPPFLIHFSSICNLADSAQWKTHSFIPLAYGIKKIQILAHVVDETCSVDDITEKIEAMEDLVGSVEVDSFTKL